MRIRLIGPDVCFGMAGFPCFLGLMVPLLGLLMLLSAGCLVEVALGSYSSSTLAGWGPSL